VFISQLLPHLRIDVERPVKVHVDNIGAIFLAENQNTSDRTKHVDICFHFICQHIQERTVKVEFVKSRENDVDLFTKNVNGETFEEHRGKMVWTRAEYECAAQESTTGRVLEDVVHFPKSQYLTKMTSPYLLKTTSPIESHFNKVDKGKGQKALDCNVNQCEAHVRGAENNKQFLVDSILWKIKLIL